MAKQSKLDIGLRSKEQPEEKVNENSEDKNHSELFGTPLDERNIYSVKGISHRIKRILEQSEDLQGIWIRGEISNYTKHSSGHLYFTLKDEEATLSCVKFRGTGKKVRFDLDQGIKVIAFGDIGVYPPQGKYQFIVDEIRPDGLGALHMAFLQLKDKLSKEGLFDEIHKKPLPRIPRTIGIATSITGAALRDMLNIISRRFPAVTILIKPTQVQGEGAAESIIKSIKILDKISEVDVIIVGRGGGSIEDLWAFNEEPLVRAVFKAKHSIISAVGHQTVYTLIDFVAD